MIDMKAVKRAELEEAFANFVVDSLDMETLMQHAYDSILGVYMDMEESHLMAEIKDYAPHLLDEEDQNDD